MISKRYILVCVLIIATGDSEQKSTESSSSYKAGVAEFHGSDNGTFDKTILDNLAGYKILIGEAKQQDVDILVFPEATLNYYNIPGNFSDDDRQLALDYATFVPDPARHLIPCDLDENNNEHGGDNDSLIVYSDFFKELSCEAKSAEMYLVINLQEKSYCSNEIQKLKNDTRPCSRDGFNLYNTNVVFDRKGAVISRYRKFNLFLEAGVNTTHKAEHSTFRTDFGVRFGHFICFDIMFHNPAEQMVRAGITDFIFPTMWFSQMPFLTAIQVQENWAFANDVNLLAAGASSPNIGSGGSGIYAGHHGALVFSMTPEPVRRILVSDVKKIVPGRKKQDEKKGHQELHTYHQDLVIPRENYPPEVMDAYNMLSENLTSYTSEKINFGEFSRLICSNEKFCCHFNLTTMELPVLDDKKTYEYRAVAYKGFREWGDRTGDVLVCSIVSCSGSEITDCGVKYPDFTKVAPRMRFTHIKISAEFPSSQDVLTTATSLSYSLSPLSRERMHIHKSHSSARTHRNTITGFGNSKGHPDLSQGTVLMMEKVQVQLRGPPADDLHTFGLFARDYSAETGTSGASNLVLSVLWCFGLLVSYLAL